MNNIYNITMPLDYFSNPAISNSDLGEFIKSPKAFRYKKDKGISDKSSSLDFGTYVHALCFEPDTILLKYYDQEIAKVEGMMGSFIENLVNTDESTASKEACYIAAEFKWKFETVLEKFNSDAKCQAYYIALKAAQGKTILSPRDIYKARKCLVSLKSNLSINNLLFDTDSWLGNHIISLNELEIYFDIDELACKSKIDRLVIDPVSKIVYEVDLKTYQDNFISNYKKFNYERQRAYYKKAIEIYVFDNYGFIPEIRSYIVAINTEEPFEPDLYFIPEEDLDLTWQRLIYPKLMELKQCAESGVWEKRYKRNEDGFALNAIIIQNDYYKR